MGRRDKVHLEGRVFPWQGELAEDARPTREEDGHRPNAAVEGACGQAWISRYTKDPERVTCLRCKPIAEKRSKSHGTSE